MKLRFPHVMLIYVIAIGTVVLVGNYLKGHLIEEWGRIGEGKLRVGRDFAAFVGLFGIWVYLLAPFSALIFLREAIRTGDRRQKIIHVACAVVSIGFLVCFLVLNVARFIAKT